MRAEHEHRCVSLRREAADLLDHLSFERDGLAVDACERGLGGDLLEHLLGMLTLRLVQLQVDLAVPVVPVGRHGYVLDADRDERRVQLGGNGDRLARRGGRCR